MSIIRAGSFIEFQGRHPARVLLITKNGVVVRLMNRKLTFHAQLFQDGTGEQTGLANTQFCWRATPSKRIPEPAFIRWDESLIGTMIQIQGGDGIWYEACVTVVGDGVFDVLYTEEETKEKVRLLPDFTASDPEQTEFFKWRLIK